MMLHKLRRGPLSTPPLSPTLLVLLTVLLVACAGPTAPTSTPGGGSSGDTPLAVLGAEDFYADLLAQVGGAHVRATSLLSNPNADPHEFETSPQDGALVADARLVIVNGVGYDDFMQHLLEASPTPSRLVIDVQRLVGAADDANAHLWYDPTTMPRVAQAAADALSGLDPANAAAYAAGAQAYIASLAPIARRVASLRAAYAGVPVAVTEPVAGYLAQAIGLDVRTPIGFQKAIEDGFDPGPADVAAERDLLTGRQVRVLLYNDQVVSPVSQQMRDLAVQHGIPVVGMAELMPAAYDHYADWQVAQLDALGAALAGSAG